MGKFRSEFVQSMQTFFLIFLESVHRRITTEGQAKVVAAVWGAEFIQFLATLAVLH